MAGGKPESATGAAASQQVTTMRWATSSIGSAYYLIGAAVAKVINENVPEVSITVNTASGSLEAYTGLVERTTEIGGANNDFAYWGAKGGSPDNPAYMAGPDVRTWFVAIPTPLAVISRDDNKKFTNFTDITKSGLKIGANAKGSSSWNGIVDALNVIGADENKITWYNGGLEENANALRDGNVDATATFNGMLTGASSAYQDLANGINIIMHDLPEKVLAELPRTRPYYQVVTVPAGWLNGVTKDVKTVGVYTSILVHKSIDEELLYKMTKALFENLDELREIHPNYFALIGPETSARNAVCEFHPGSLRYFKEKGFPIQVASD
jgi:TRAP transporter TAXI family solute receptor